MTPAKPSSRILTLDLMRGYFLVAIILDHLNFFPNGLEWWSARGDMYVTTAEGFFLISGIVLGIVRGRRLIDRPMSYVTRLLLKRSLQLYLTLVIAVLLFTFLGWAFFMDNPGLKWGISAPGTPIAELLWRTLTLQYSYGWVDYLRLYAIFMLVSPLALLLLRRGKWHVLLAINLWVWLLNPAGPGTPDATQELLQPISWQLLFFGGMTLGFYWQSITSWWGRLSQRVRIMTITSVLALSVLIFLINLVIAFVPKLFGGDIPREISSIGHKLYVYYFDKEQLPLARLVLFALWFSAGLWLFTRFQPLIIRTFGWLLLPFGTNSLYVYTLHAFIIFGVHLVLRPSNIVVNFLVTIGIIASIRLAIHYKILMKIIPR